MAILTRRSQQQQQPGVSSQQPSIWDPFQEMRELMNFDFPVRQLSMPATFSPAFEVKENPTHYVFKADVPGMKEQDIDIQVSGDRLTISGKREAEKEDKGDTWYTYERSYGDFSRSFTLPSNVNTDDVQADLKDGVLTLLVAKTQQQQAKKISVKSGEKVKA